MKENFSKQEIQQLREALPLDGIVKIAELSGISKATVYKFFNHKQIRKSTAGDIVEMALKVIQQESSYIAGLKMQIEKLSKKEDGTERK